MINNKSNKQILKEFNVLMEGHDSFKKQLINLVTRSNLYHYQKHVLGVHHNECIAPSNLLVIGPSGTGKTHGIYSLKKIVDFPFLYIDATKLSPSGAAESSGIKSKDLDKLILQNAKDLCFAQPIRYPSVLNTVDQTIVFIDEIDKLGNSNTHDSAWNRHVQSNFLTLFDTTNKEIGTTFIFGGAFSGLTKKTKTKAKSIGFTNHDKEEEADIITDEQLINYGFLPEFVGRIGRIVQLDEFSIKDYKKVLENRLLPTKQKEMEHFNCYDISLTPEEKDAICIKAYESGQGIRSLKRELDKLFLDKEFDYEDREMQCSSIEDDWTQKLV